MKVEELMVGDWLWDRANDCPWQLNIKDFRCEERILSELEPIPLTPEILEKNGFEYHRDAGYIDNDYNGTQIIYDSWNRRLKIIIEYNVALDIDSFREMRVHELQHALRVCGIDQKITL